MRVRLGYDHIYSQIMIRRESYQTDSNADPSRYQHQGRSQKGEQELSRQESVKSSTRSDGSGHSVLETLGQTQSGGDDGDDVGCEEFSMSNKLPGREAEYLGEQTGGAGIEYNVAKINITSKTRYKKYNMYEVEAKYSVHILTYEASGFKPDNRDDAGRRHRLEAGFQ